MEGYFGRGAFDHFIDSGQVLQTAPSMGPTEAQVALESGDVHLLDVRSTAEFEEGHIPGAHHCHLGMLADRLEEVPRDGTVLVSCRTGARSAMGQGLLLRAGFERVVNLEGGWLAWRTAGLPVTC